MRIVLSLSIVLAAGCGTTESLGGCPEIETGQLIITEVHGDGAEWIEIFSTQALDITGLTVSWEQLTGKNIRQALVRDEVKVAQGYFLIAKGEFPDSVFDFGEDLPSKMWSSAAVTLSSCGKKIDQVIYRSLPDEASLQFGNPPDATGNDDEASWCSSTDIPGSPGEENPPCL